MPNRMTSQERLKLAGEVQTLIPCSRNHPITGNELAKLVHRPDDRQVRIIIRELIAKGVPIASAVSPPMGFYRACTKEEATEYVHILLSRIREDNARLNDFILASKRIEGAVVSEQMSLI